MDRFRMFEHAWIRDQTQEREHAGPWQTDGSGSVQLLIEPVAREIVLSERTHMRVDKDVGIDQYHLKPSPSAMARASPILSMLAIRTRPSATARVRMASRGLRRLPISTRPRRNASLIRRFRLIRRLRRNRSSVAATSSLRVRVVLLTINAYD